MEDFVFFVKLTMVVMVKAAASNLLYVVTVL
jgi:hypothetical protein